MMEPPVGPTGILRKFKAKAVAMKMASSAMLRIVIGIFWNEWLIEKTAAAIAKEKERARPVKSSVSACIVSL